ncbi:hypothetical protein RHGRI_033430 [Rhododendron griersonianum]|uniref:Trichome birefringence-like N-terminal domain-containing protein n=1 Tax=Rhododendron griersonianum TaxID=479676 RepID=A0AAV6HZA3_9ERIC|nr:hypothetical protein RHGRI_033430 [Rhododendron griersonianum]
MRKLAVSDQFPYCVSPRRKVVSGFSLGLVVSLIVLSVVLFNVSFKGPFVSPMFQGFSSSRVNNNSSASLVSWPFSFSSTTAFSSPPSNSSRVSGSIASDEDMQNSGDKTHEVNGSVVGKKGDVLGSNGVGINLGKTNGSLVNGDVLGSNGEGMSLGKTHVGNFSEKVKNGSLTLVEGRVKEKTQFVYGSDIGKHANFTKSEGEGAVSGTTHAGNFSEKVENGSLTHAKGRVENGSEIGKKANSAKSEGEVAGLGTTHVGNFSEEVKNGSFGGGDVVAGKSVNEVSLNTSVNKVTGDGHVGNLSNSNIGNISVPSNDPQPVKKQKDSVGNCDIFDGRWVRDETKPYYPAGSCPFIDKDFDCHLNGRPDGEYLKWKWKPYGCDIPSFNATDFLERLRGKKLVFVGDSLNRNMWESLVCILHQSDYNCTVDFVSSPFLVREMSVNGSKGPLETLRLDLMDQTTSMYADADVVVFNTAHWWTHEKTSRGEDYYQEGNHVYPRLHVLEAYKKALKTWGRWIDKNIDGSRTQVIFRGFSLIHFRGGRWNSGGKCNKETEPIFNEKFLSKYPSKMKVLEDIVQEMKTTVIYLNISRLTDYRIDGHPSIYRRQYDTVEEQIAAMRFQDCSHWCLPGVPDTWNELLYASLLQAGKGSWGS